MKGERKEEEGKQKLQREKKRRHDVDDAMNRYENIILRQLSLNRKRLCVKRVNNITY